MLIHRKIKKGFTLIEVLIAITVVVIISVVVLAIINPDRQRDRASDAVLQKYIVNIAEAVEAYGNLRDEIPGCSETGGFMNFIDEDIRPESVGFAGCDLADSSGPDFIDFSNEGVSVGGVPGDPVRLYITDSDQVAFICIEAPSNDDPDLNYIWLPNNSVNRIGITCEELMNE